MIPTRLCASTLLLTVATVLSAQSEDPGIQAQAFSAEVLRDACENLVLAVRGLNPISQDDPGAMLCLGYVAGWSQAMDTLPQLPFCLPEAARERPGDLADLIVTYIDGHPNVRQGAAHDAMLQALVEAFPCTADTESQAPADDGPVDR